MRDKATPACHRVLRGCRGRAPREQYAGRECRWLAFNCVNNNEPEFRLSLLFFQNKAISIQLLSKNSSDFYHLKANHWEHLPPSFLKRPQSVIALSLGRCLCWVDPRGERGRSMHALTRLHVTGTPLPAPHTPRREPCYAHRGHLMSCLFLSGTVVYSH